jgi:redox-sensitive bicupin YhaK (pirin superfamily)
MQWMTAGSGIIHQEMPRGDGKGVMEGFQLWANLPKSHKMMDPRYRDIKSVDVPEVVTGSGARIKVICGTVEGKSGPVTGIVIDPEYLDVFVPPDSEFVHATTPGHTVFAYVIAGKAVFCNEKNPFSYDALGENYFDMERDAYIRNGTAVLFDDGDQVTVTTQGDPVRFLLVSGKPIKEPIAWYGPIVMNTEEELEEAFYDYRAGTFIRSRG